MADITVKNMPLKVGHTLTVTRFALDIHSGSDIAFHMSVRFNKTIVVYNSLKAGVWGTEVFQGGFPFKHKQLFKFTVTLTREEFLVVLSDGSEIHFPNRLGASEYKDFNLNKGVVIRSFEIN